jgi:hypothetical protein
VLGDGIVVGLSDVRINDNDIAPYVSAEPAPRPARPVAGGPVLTLTSLRPVIAGAAAADNFGNAGIVLVQAQSRDKKAPLARCHIVGNRIRKVSGNGIDLRGATVLSAIIKQNIIDAVLGSGIVMDEASSAVAMAIENNQIGDLAPPARSGRIIAGILLQGSDQVEIAHNAIFRISAHTEVAVVAGILLLKCTKVKINNNNLSDIAPPETPFAIGLAGFSISGAFGIFVAGSAEGLEVAGNSIRRMTDKPFDKLPGDELSWCGLYVESRGHEVALIRGNVIEAFGRIPAALLRVGGICLFDGNECRWKSANVKQPALLIETGAALKLNSNFIEHSNNGIAASLFAADNTCVILGNLTRGIIQLNNTPVGPAVPLNVALP